MNVYETKLIIGIIGIIAIAIACYRTKSGTPLWALILLSILLSEI